MSGWLQIDEIEWETQNVEVLEALAAGTAALDQLHKEMPIDEVERILEESAESIEVGEEGLLLLLLLLTKCAMYRDGDHVICTN